MQCFTLFSSALFPLLCLTSSVPLLSSLCPTVVFCFVFSSCFVCLVCWLFDTLCKCRPWSFTQTLSSGSECTTDLLHTCFATHRPLLVFSRVSPLCAFNATFHVGFRPARDRLPPDCRHLHSFVFPVSPLVVFFFNFACICLFFHCYFLVCFLLFVPFIWLFFHFCHFIFLYVFSFLFACNKALFSQIVFWPWIYLHLVQTFWVVNVNDILTFWLRRISILAWESLLSRLMNKCYLCIEWYLFDIDLKLNLMISYRLVNDYVMADLFSFSYNLLQNFCFVCKNFLLLSLWMRMKYFSFLKKNQLLIFN